MSAWSQQHVCLVLAGLSGAEGFPGTVPCALTPAAKWRLGKNGGYTALQVPEVRAGQAGPEDDPPRAGKHPLRAVLALLTMADGRCAAVTMTPGRVVCRVRFPTVPLTYFRGTLLDGYMAESAFVVTDAVACRGRRVLGEAHPRRMELARELVEAAAAAPTQARPGDPLPLRLLLPTTRTLDECVAFGEGTHLLVPADRRCCPGRTQHDTFLYTFADLVEMLPGA
ncbi:MAG: hypothetical protein EOP01_04760 [Propionibacteriaceae bacterium]|nr:MAG: hypothetical protein EOP01_04760 [Propionibacteriaceae bacterium]